MEEERVSKGTLHYMKQNAMGDKPFTLKAHIREVRKTIYIDGRDDPDMFKKKKKTIPQNQLLFQIFNCRENRNHFSLFV